MPSPQGYFEDDDPPPRRSPMLVGDMARLAGARPTAEARATPGPALTPRQRKMRRKHIIILLARVNGLPLSFIADAFGLTPPEITRVCRRMGYDEI